MEKPEAGMACGYQARGRPPKKDYDAEALMQELIDTVTEVYQTTNEIKATAMELFLPLNEVKKAADHGRCIEIF